MVLNQKKSGELHIDNPLLAESVESDLYCGGIRDRELVVIGSGEGVGKSIFHVSKDRDTEVDVIPAIGVQLGRYHPINLKDIDMERVNQIEELNQEIIKSMSIQRLQLQSDIDESQGEE